MPPNRKKGAASQKAFRRGLLSLCDSFAEFSDQCTFLCDAFAAISAREETIDPHTANGIGFAARHLKQRVREIRSDLSSLNQQARNSQ
jgi:hypothetical protein